MIEVSEYQSIEYQSACAAYALLDLGIHPGDRICISAPNSVELFSVLVGALRIGIAPAVVSSSATEREIREMCRDIATEWVFRETDLQALIRDMNLEPRNLNELRNLPSCRPIHFTSGTSGRPKAVWSGWLTHEESEAWIADETAVWGFCAEDIHLVNGPLSHSAPLRFALMTFFNSGALIIPPKFTAETAIEAISRFGVTTTFMAPTHLQRIMESIETDRIPHSIRFIAHAGSTCKERIRLWTHEIFGVDKVFEFYGSTEGQFTVFPGSQWQEHPGSVGQVRPNREIRADSLGLLWSRSPAYAQFIYWGDEAKTHSTWSADNWFSVGDYGRIDAEGFVYLEGRKGDLIISGGVNVYPAEIERVLSNMPGIDCVVAFGLPDSIWGERVCVAVSGDVSESEVQKYLTFQLSAPKRPKSIFWVEEFPLTHSGKVDRLRIQNLLRESN